MNRQQAIACTLREHQCLPPSGKKKSATTRQMPSWQVNIRLAMQEMESYTHNDLAAGKEDDMDKMDLVDEEEEHHSHYSRSVLD
jgi:hypothetical protein